MKSHTSLVAQHPREFLKGYDGICVTDGYQIYHGRLYSICSAKKSIMNLIYRFGTRDNKNDHARVLIYSSVAILF